VLYNDVIEVKPEKIEKHSMINIFKYTIQFLEFSYSVSERMGTEKRKFLEIFHKDFEMPQKGSYFGSNCMKRKDFIHEGNLNIGISPKDSQMSLGKTILMTSINNGFDEACEWINSIYGLMLNNIE